MKRILYIISAAVLTLGMAACAKDELAQKNGTGKDYVPQYKMLTAQIQNEDDVRTHLVEKEDGSRDKYVVWDDNDEIAVKGSEGGVEIYKLVSGGGTQQAQFEYQSGSTAGAPFSVFSPSSVVSEGDLVWPEQQYRVAEGMIAGAPMVAQTEDLSQVLKFGNLGGIIRFTVKKAETAQVKDVKSIKVIADGANLSGPFTVQTLPGQTKPQAVISDKGSNSIELVCNPAVPITTEGVPFFIAMPAGEYLNIRFEIKSSDDKVVSLAAKYATIKVGRSSIASLSKTASNDNWIEWVDLGLPSGTLWASTNLGAQSPEDYGDYYFWGETEPWFSYEWNTGANKYKITWINGHTSSPKTDYSDLNMKKLNYDLVGNYKKFDAAYAKTGGAGCTPSKADWEELKANTTYTAKKEIDGKHYMEFVGKNGNSILLPYAGRYDTGKESALYIYEPEGYAIYQTSTHYDSSSNGYEYYAGELGSGWQITLSNFYRYQVAVPVRAIKRGYPERFVVTVNKSGKKVRFATGNLWCDASSENVADWTWHFEDTQYGGDEGTKNGQSWTYNPAHVSHFYISENGKTAGDGGYGAGTSRVNGINGADFGKVFGSDSKWTTPATEEYDYIFNTRASGAEVGTVINARYSMASINIGEGKLIRGLLIYPDNFIWDEDKLGTAPATVNKAGGMETQVYSQQEFTKLETAGIIFLPLHGNRNGATMGYTNAMKEDKSVSANPIGYYHGGSSDKSISFSSGYVSVSSLGMGGTFSVRLVTVVNPGN